MEPSRFTQQWTIEIIRQREVHWGLCADSQAMRLARQQPTLTQKVYTRARILADAQDLTEPMQRFRLWRNMLLAMLALLALLTGVGLANTVLTRNPGTVSLLDALILLLAFNMLALIFWLASFFYRGGGQGVGGILLQLGRACIKGPALSAVTQAFLSISQRAALLRPGFSSISHGFWLLLLGSAFFALWLRFLGQHYEFTWQTTILSESAVQTIISYLNSVPGFFGIQAPTPELLSGNSGLVRQQSATWLLACLALYGILPRLLFLLLTETVRYRKLRKLALEPSLPGVAELVPRFRHTPTAIIDPAPEAIEPRTSSNRGITAGSAAVILSLEHELPFDELKLPPDVHQAGMIATSEQRQQLLGQFATGGPQRVLVAIDSRLSADRGSLRFLDELAQHCQCAVWLNHNKLAPERAQFWRDQLSTQLDMLVFSEQEPALKWVSEVSYG